MKEAAPAESKPGTGVYYSNKIGQAAPANSTTYSLLVEGKDEKGGVQASIMDTILKRGAKNLSHTGYLSEKYRDFTLALTCDLKEAGGTLDDLIIHLRGMKHVTHAEAVNLKNQMFDGLFFPLVLMDTNRVVAIDSSLMFEVQEKLKTKFEKDDLIEAGRDYGKDVVSRIKKKFEELGPRTCGWSETLILSWVM